MSEAAPLDPVVLALLDRLSPSGTLRAVANANSELDAVLDRIDHDEQILEHARDASIIARLESDFASAEPELEDAVSSVAAWGIPILSAFAGPGAPLLSFGLKVAVGLGLYALRSWAKKRTAP